MYLVLIGLMAGTCCCAVDAYAIGVLCVTIGSCLQCVVYELEKIRNKLK